VAAVSNEAVEAWLADLERRLAEGPVAELPVMLAYAAGREVELDDDELSGALRRAMLLLAAGGDPRREVGLDSRAVQSLADELDSAEGRTQLARGLDRLAGQAMRLPRVRGALFDLVAAPELAWRAFSCALLAEELGDEA
jgi:hypothetical protein